MSALTPERHDALWEALMLIGETVHDIRRIGDAVDRGVATRDSCRALADRVSAARAVLGRVALVERTCGTCAHLHHYDESANIGRCRRWYDADSGAYSTVHPIRPTDERPAHGCAGWTPRQTETTP